MVRQRLDEPLFVDLRRARSGLSGYRRFRAESLRLIAALYGVDYSVLAREDERRRRFRRLLGTAAALLFALVLTAIYLITTVEAYAWNDEELPSSGRDLPGLNRGNPLLPIRDVAFRRDDPTTHLYRVRDAEYHGQRPEHSVFLDTERFEIDGERLRDDAVHRLQRDGTADAAPSPFARFVFTVADWRGDPVASGASYFYLIRLDAADSPLYYQVLALSGAEAGSSDPLQRHLISPASLTSRLNPAPNWPTEELVEAGLLPLSGTIHGVFEDLLHGTTTPAEVRIVDAREMFEDAIGPERFDVLLASNDDALEIDYGGEPIRLSDVQREVELWDGLVASGEWVVYTEPARRTVNVPHLRSRDDPARLRELREAIDVEATLAEHLVASQIAVMEHGVVEIVSRRTPAGEIRAATLLGRSFPMVASADTAVRVERRFLFAGAEDSAWRPVSLPTVEPDSTISDLIPLDAQGRRLLLLLEGEGLYHSSDAGRSWRRFNLGERRLATDGDVQVVAVGNPRVVHALVVNDLENVGDEDNHLFRLVWRDWLERLRIGLAEWLQPEG